jgi:hypothetical protein
MSLNCHFSSAQLGVVRRTRLAGLRLSLLFRFLATLTQQAGHGVLAILNYMRGGSTYSASVSTMPTSRSSTDLAAGPRSTILAEQNIELQEVHTRTRRFVSLTVRIDSETVNDVMSSADSAKTKNEKKIASVPAKRWKLL